MLEDEALTGPAFAAIEDGQRRPTMPGATRWTPRSPATRPPRTSISAPAPPTSATSATRCCDASDADGAAALRRRDSLRRRHRADPFLATDWSRAAASRCRRQRRQPRRHAGAGARRADGGRARRRAGRMCRPCPARRRAWRLVLNPSDARASRHFATRRRPSPSGASRRGAISADPPRRRRRRRCGCMVNIADPAEVDSHRRRDCDGVGLMRTEFLFGRRGLPDEETQYGAYRRVLEWAGGKPVTIRTVDAGGDKPVPGLHGRGEQSVPRPARHPPVAGPAGDVPRADPGAAASRACTAISR